MDTAGRDMRKRNPDEDHLTIRKDGPMGPTHRLVSEDGTELGARTFNAPVWAPGDEIPLGGGRSYVVVDVILSTGDGELETLVVREEQAGDVAAER
jgi:hypothetical protein